MTKEERGIRVVTGLGKLAQWLTLSVASGLGLASAVAIAVVLVYTFGERDATSFVVMLPFAVAWILFAFGLMRVREERFIDREAGKMVTERRGVWRSLEWRETDLSRFDHVASTNDKTVVLRDEDDGHASGSQLVLLQALTGAGADRLARRLAAQLDLPFVRDRDLWSPAAVKAVGKFLKPLSASMRLQRRSRDQKDEDIPYTSCFNTTWWRGRADEIPIAIRGELGARSFKGELLVGGADYGWKLTFEARSDGVGGQRRFVGTDAYLPCESPEELDVIGITESFDGFSKAVGFVSLEPRGISMRDWGPGSVGEMERDLRNAAGLLRRMLAEPDARTPATPLPRWAEPIEYVHGMIHYLPDPLLSSIDCGAGGYARDLVAQRELSPRAAGIALCMAIEAGAEEVVEPLLERVDVNAMHFYGGRGWTLLALAVASNRIEIVDALLQRGADTKPGLEEIGLLGSTQIKKLLKETEAHRRRAHGHLTVVDEEGGGLSLAGDVGALSPAAEDEPEQGGGAD